MEPASPQKKVNYTKLTYFEFVALPQLFHEYINSLVSKHRLNILQDLWQSFSMTLIELASQSYYQSQYLKDPIINWTTNIDMATITASPITHQLFQFLKTIILKMPFGQFPVSANQTQHPLHPRIHMFILTINQCIKDQCKLLKTVQKSQIPATKYKMRYLNSLKGYFIGWDIIRIANNSQLKVGANSIQLYMNGWQQSRQFLKAYSHIPGYKKFNRNFQNITNKIKYVFRGINTSEKPMNAPVISLQSNEQMKPQNDSRLHQFYEYCQNLDSKHQFIVRLIKQIINPGSINKQKIRKIQLLLYYEKYQLEMSQFGNSNISNGLSQQFTNRKADILIYMSTLKLLETKNCQIIDELKMIFNLKKPSFQSQWILFSSALKLCDHQQNKNLTIDSPLKKLIDYLITELSANNKKFEIQIQNTIKLVKQFINPNGINQKVLYTFFQCNPTMQHIKCLSVLDTLINFIISDSQFEFKLGFQLSSNNSLFTYAEFRAELQKCSELKFNKEDNMDQLQLKQPLQHLKILQMLIKRRKYLSPNPKTKMFQILLYFMNMQNIKHTQMQQQQQQYQSSKMSLKSLNYLIQQLNQLLLSVNNGSHYITCICIQSQTKQPYIVSDKQNNLLYLIQMLLYWNLCVCGYYLEALVCIQLNVTLKKGYLSYIDVAKQVNTNQWYYKGMILVNENENNKYSEKLMDCLVNFDAFQIFMETFTCTQMYQMSKNWLLKNNTDNYENITQMRKQRRIHIKRNKFYNILWGKLTAL